MQDFGLRCRRSAVDLVRTALPLVGTVISSRRLSSFLTHLFKTTTTIYQRQTSQFFVLSDMLASVCRRRLSVNIRNVLRLQTVRPRAKVTIESLYEVVYEKSIG